MSPLGIKAAEPFEMLWEGTVPKAFVYGRQVYWVGRFIATELSSKQDGELSVMFVL